MPVIRQLPEYLINRIAAGEVIENPAAAVRELTENALDAGATSIIIELREGGKSFLSVDDDGHGMSPDDMKLAIQRHATSKLSEDDLVNILTFGFRGEALPSIGAVSRMMMASREKNASTAWRITVDGGRVNAPEPAARSAGTRVEVRDLFYATPARLKFLRGDVAEATAVKSVVARLALAHPGVRFALQNDGRTLMSVAPVADAMMRVEQIVGDGFIRESMPLEATRDGVRLHGYAGLPTFSRGNAQHQYLFVNGRPVRDRLLLGALKGAYADMLMGGRYPVAVLFLNVPPTDMDINVHPAKQEVRFRDAGMIRGLLVAAVQQALQAHARERRSPPYIQAQPAQNRIRESEQKNLDAQPLGFARAQLHASYIVAQTSDGVAIIDQHAAHECIVYERLKESLAAGGILKQPLLVPEIVTLKPAYTGLLLENAEMLADLGLQIEAFGPESIAVRAVPLLLTDRIDFNNLLQDAAEQLGIGGKDDAMRDALVELMARQAAHWSARSNRTLNADEMNALLRQMEMINLSNDGRNGRIPYVMLSLDELEKLFPGR